MDNNDFINKEYLKNLPSFHAPEKIWVNLETSMFSIDPAVLPAFNPPSNAWASLEKTLLFRKRLYRITVIILLLLAISLPGLYLINNQSPDPKTQHAILNRAEEQSISNPEIIMISEDEVRNYSEPQTVIPMTSDEQIVESLTSVESVETNESVETLESVEAVDIVETLEMNIESSGREESFVSTMKKKNSLIEIESFHTINFRDRPDECSSFSGRTSTFFWGPSYEYSFFLTADSYLETEQKYWQSASINGRLCFGNFFLESGLGISLARDNTPWSYDFNSYELINSYEYVDSVDYDPVSGETIYYTSIIDVYDSVPHTNTSTVGKTHTYLRLPLFAGINLYKGNAFGVSLSGGVIYNLLISKNSTTISYNEPDGRITSVNFTETTRMENNFNLSLRMNFEWELNHSLDLYVYPSFNYYLNSIFKEASYEQPMSVGLGVGLWLK